MELGVPGDGPGVAAREGPTSARLPSGYKTRDYKDRKRRNVAVALLQILQPHRTTYMTSWQVEFVELALAGTPIHWARILWKATRQHAGEEKGGSINHLSPFLINFYRLMGCLTAEERVQFPLLFRANLERFVRDVEVDTDFNELPASTPPARSRADDEQRGWRCGLESAESADCSSQASGEQRARKPPEAEGTQASSAGGQQRGHRERHASTAIMPALERCLPSEQVLQFC
ncbi:hypothetical protein AXG93_1856s1020 [Marchantia polymorpha subsp. ruderalis]|uniref:Uncharacterized protein n=1 Tax=Marchantia polymorpha subsp. ruderalis TaxID=1480154 RepID=A0A176VS02_MARPO|nr:hypothetical protein AXG93_1856s1020 [Marchantia polymorpha subsp. ruderalis]